MIGSFMLTPGDVMSCSLVTSSTVQFPQNHKRQEDDDEEHDGDSDTHQYGSVVRVSGDGLGPGGLTELVSASVGADLENVSVSCAS